MRTANTKPSGTRIQNFDLTAPGATSVQLVGDFTHWLEHPINMRKTTNGIWHATIRLKHGVHPYRFLVDGQWRDDPTCPMHTPNSFGGRDAVRLVH